MPNVISNAEGRREALARRREQIPEGSVERDGRLARRKFAVSLHEAPSVRQRELTLKLARIHAGMPKGCDCEAQTPEHAQILSSS